MENLYTYFPIAPLNFYIHQMWLAKDYHPTYAQERILPHGSMELLFDLTQRPVTMYYPHDGYRPHTFTGPVLSGGFSDFFGVDTSRAGDYLAVWFKPGAAGAFFGLSALEIHNQHVPLDCVWGPPAIDLYHQLLAATSPMECFRLLEKALLDHFLYENRRHQAVNFALNAFHQWPQPFTIRSVTEQIGLSPTRFIHLFKQEIGITPKVYCRVLRFQEVLRHIVTASTPNWAGLALECGYFDQAHLINDFQALAGISPTQYHTNDPDHRSNIPFSLPS